MTKILDEAIQAMRKLPPSRRQALARLVLRLAKSDAKPETIDPDHLPAVLKGLAQAKRRKFATEAQVEAAFRRFDR